MIETKCNGLAISSALAPLLTSSHTGSVAGVYARCFNVLADDDMLLTVFAGAEEIMPTGLHTDLPPTTDLGQYGIENDMAVCIQGKTITIPEIGFVCDFSDAAVVQLKREPLAHISPHRDIARNMGQVLNILTCEGSHAGIGKCKTVWWQFLHSSLGEWPAVDDNLCRRVLRGISFLFRSMVHVDEESIKERLRDIVGLGIGLTPSADDVLSGMTAWLYLCPGGKEAYAAFFSALKNFLSAEGNSRTTLVSRALLEHSASGVLSDPLYQLIVAVLCGAHKDDVDTATRRVLKYGASSGTEIGLGLAAGFVMTSEELLLERRSSQTW